MIVQLQPAATLVDTRSDSRARVSRVLVGPHELSGPTESSSWIRFEGDQFTLTDLAPVPSIPRARQGENGAAVELTLTPGQTTDVDVRLSAEIPVTGPVWIAPRASPCPGLGSWVTGETYSSQVMPGGMLALKLPPGPHMLLLQQHPRAQFPKFRKRCENSRPGYTSNDLVSPT